MISNRALDIREIYMKAFTHCIDSFYAAFYNYKFTDDTDYSNLIEDITDFNIAWVTVGKSVPVCLTNIRLARSFGIKWTVIEAGDAFHGDFGALTDKHIIGYVSKSGNTEELLKTAEYLKGRPAFAITSNPTAKILAYTNTQNLIIPIDDEGSPWNHAPFVSTALYLIVMNALLAEVIERKGVTKERYAWNHPGGTIGKDLKKELE